MNTTVSIQFLGGVADNLNLTGSSILLTIRQKKRTKRILIDAGLIQADIKSFMERNLAILDIIKPEMLDAIILTHGHTDHIGRLPLLVKHGFEKKSRIFCTEPTAQILEVMLEDSAKIQEEMAITLNKKAKKTNEKPKLNGSKDRLTRGNYDRQRRKQKQQQKTSIDPLFTMEDVEKSSNLVKNGGYEYYKWIKVFMHISLKFYPSGHVLGGAICVLRIEGPEKNMYFGFSGDLGRSDGVILPPPDVVDEPIDYWFLESTYGDKVHPEREFEIQILKNTIKEAVKEKRKIIIPSFALERAQELIYLISSFMQKGEIPEIDMYLDSPMATKLTNIFAKNWHTGMFQGQSELSFNPFDIHENEYLKVISDHKDSQTFIQTQPGPYIVIAGSGMCDAGRVREHLRSGLGSPNTTVCIVGYMAENSLGRKLKDKWPVVKMNGDEIIVKAKIISFDSFSAHADQLFLTSYTCQLFENNPQESEDFQQTIFINHGEVDGANALKKSLMENLLPKHNLYDRIIIPQLNETFIVKED